MPGMMRGKKKMREGGKVKGGFPDLNDDGKVTKADVLKGRGVEYKNGGCVMSGRGVRDTKMV